MHRGKIVDILVKGCWRWMKRRRPQRRFVDAVNEDMQRVCVTGCAWDRVRWRKKKLRKLFCTVILENPSQGLHDVLNSHKSTFRKRLIWPWHTTEHHRSSFLPVTHGLFSRIITCLYYFWIYLTLEYYFNILHDEWSAWFLTFTFKHFNPWD